MTQDEYGEINQGRRGPPHPKFDDDRASRAPAQAKCNGTHDEPPCGAPDCWAREDPPGLGDAIDLAGVTDPWPLAAPSAQAPPYDDTVPPIWETLGAIGREEMARAQAPTGEGARLLADLRTLVEQHGLTQRDYDLIAAWAAPQAATGAPDAIQRQLVEREARAIAAATPAAVVPTTLRESALAYLDELGDDAAAHIWPEDLESCARVECVVQVHSVRMTRPVGYRTVPLFSRQQLVDALAAAPVERPDDEEIQRWIEAARIRGVVEGIESERTLQRADAALAGIHAAPVAPDATLIGSFPRPEGILLTDKEIVEVWASMPGGPDGWLKQFGPTAYAEAILMREHEKRGALADDVRAASRDQK